jgi:CTP synthase
MEFAGSCLNLDDVNSTEFNPSCLNPLIDVMPDHEGKLQMGGTLRLGAYPCKIVAGSRMAAIYGQNEIMERHRHRYEFNSVHQATFEAAGMKVSGISPDGRLVEAVELADHDFFIGVQYHPEFKSRPNRAHPLFREFIAAAMRNQAKAKE